MKILLDESVPHKLRLLIDGGHSVVTTWFQGWSGLQNGALLSAADEAGFDLFITADQEISYQQNLSGRRIAMLVLSTNNWGIVKEMAAEISAAVDSVTPGSFAVLDIGHGSKQWPARLRLPREGSRTTIPNHGGREIRPQLLNLIGDQPGIILDRFERRW